MQPPGGPWDPNNPRGANPYVDGPAQNPHTQPQNPYAQNPYAQPQNPYAQNPYAQNPYAQNPYAPPQGWAGPQGWPQPGYPGGPPFDPAAVQAQVDRYNKMSFSFGVPGLLLQVVSNLLGSSMHPSIGMLASLAGSGLLIVGLGYYAMSRGQSKWFGLLGFLSCIGLLVLALLPKKCLVCTGPVQRGFCQRCGAPGAK